VHLLGPRVRFELQIKCDVGHLDVGGSGHQTQAYAQLVVVAQFGLHHLQQLLQRNLVLAAHRSGRLARRPQLGHLVLQIALVLPHLDVVDSRGLLRREPRLQLLLLARQRFESLLLCRQILLAGRQLALHVRHVRLQRADVVCQLGRVRKQRRFLRAQRGKLGSFLFEPPNVLAQHCVHSLHLRALLLNLAVLVLKLRRELRV
jgi:hypothetical protein